MSMNIGKNGYGGSGGVVDEDNGVVGVKMIGRRE